MRRIGLILGGVAVVAAIIAIVIVLNVTGGSGGGAQVTATTSAASAQTSVPGTFSPSQLYQQSSPGVVMVVSTFTASGGQALGSGFVVDAANGTILTNAHVVTQNGQKATSVQVAFNKGQDQTTPPVKATLVGVDETTDVAVLKVDPSTVKRPLKALPLGDSSKVVIGQWVVAIGNPLGYNFSLSQGIVSGVGRNLQAPNGAVIPNGIQTDAAINQGNSGGPLIAADGNVIGINEQIASTTGGFTGIGFAIPINTARTVMEQILQTGSAKHAYLGIEGQTIDPAIAQALGLPVQQGVLIARVQAGTAAAKAGLKGGSRTQTIQGAPFITGGDIITKVDGQTLTGMDQLASFIAQKQPGDTITLTVLRDGKSQDITVTLGNRPPGQ